jgi:anthranilate phosphoribosyltransferase
MDPTREAIREIAARIVSGQLAPIEGAEQIAAHAAQLPEPGELAVFAELARTGAETAILEQAPLLLADTA